MQRYVRLHETDKSTHLGEHFTKDEEHIVVAQTVAQLPLLDWPRDQGGKEQRLIQLQQTLGVNTWIDALTAHVRVV
jgi:hypothetical protein